jgi:hypothetical protein
MPTISADRALRAAAALFLLGSAAVASAGGTIEMDPRTEAFASRAACEKALEQRHSAARSRFESLSPSEKRGNKVGKLERNGDEHLSYVEKVELGAGTAEIDLPGSQTEQFTCRGSTLEHRIDYGMGGR